ncbi:Asp23/Gls24 family envelope stress response protein [Streptomyces kaniharaensis]|uniref:Asp23/Gls24 family envelope stress response protein n=1 Tax=Streptomyces kaniharaensis TaxID=212423 RepID=A0A6N7KWB8_9ACTN|nr:Asp23/Gls24 family envelope stress response protein [Streptomyces kaniharaensis]MQS14617.1 Asp23/Gls24 family envelope stress response protein [Streptomyces kaniharaensis]
MAALTAPRRESAIRGRLRLADRVYARIAARAAREALAGAWIGRTARGKPPTVSVAVPGSTVTVRVAVELPFPADVAGLARAVRDRVVTQVNGLTGTRVSEVVVVVERLVTGGRA